MKHHFRYYTNPADVHRQNLTCGYSAVGKMEDYQPSRMAKKYDCAFVDNEMPYGRVPQGHPVIVDYFYHEEIRGTENTGKRNR